MKDNWIESYTTKPPEYEIVHGISQTGKELDIVECWWTGESWAIRSVRSNIVSTNIVYWKHKPEIPDFIKERFQNET